ncbi:MAG: ATP-binding protein [Armatimonadota bacterium]
MDRHFFSRLRIRLLLLVLIAVIPALGMMIYTDLLVRRQAEAGANQEALRLARQASVSLDLAWLNMLATEARLPEGTTLTVIDSTGLILARHPDPQKWVGRSVPEAPVVNAVLAQAREGTVEAAGLDGVRRLYAFTPLGSPTQAGRAYVSVGIPTAVAFAEVNHLLGRNLVGLALVVLLGFTAAWLVSNRFILRQVNALVAATGRLSAGDLSARTGLAREGGELHQLAGAFDDMAAALQQRAVEAERAEAALRRYTERLEVLHKTDQAILTAQSPEAVADAALRQIQNLVPCQRVSLALYDFTANEIRVLATRSLGENPAEAGTRISFEAIGNFDETLDVLRKGKVHTADLQALSRPTPFIQAMKAAGMRYVTVVPLMAQGQLIGSLSLTTDSPGPMAPEYLDVAREVADQLAVAIQHAQMREDLQQHAAVLEQRVAERTVELEKARHEADRANKAKSEFLSRMSHELRTPLNAILGFAQILEMDSLNPDQRESVADILKGGRHLLDLINEVLDIARIEAGRLAISLEPVAVQEIVKEALDLTRPLAAQMDIRLDGEPAGPDERHVTADRQRLKQVLLNLLANGIKYNRRGGMVTLSYQEAPGDRFRILVTDTGLGIPPERLERLFTPFERLGAEQTGVEGTGLGLALSKRLVEAMGGTLGVKSTVGQGSMFWVELAVAKSPVPRLEEIQKDLPGLPQLGASGRTRIVLIEDNLSNVKVIQRLLANRQEVTLIPTMQGRLGLSLARQHHPHLILLDLHLPDISGHDVLQQLQADPETAKIPVVVVSADATPGQIERVLAAGARAYLTKPLEVKKLLELLNEILREQLLSHTAGDH